MPQRWIMRRSTMTRLALLAVKSSAALKVWWRWLAWAAWACCATMMAVALLLLAQSAAHGAFEHAPSTALFMVALLAFPTAGPVIASRRPGNAIGWLFCAIGVSGELASCS